MFMQGETDSTHPLPIIRVQAILKWAESDQYKDILDGKYPREDVPVLGPAGQRFCESCGQSVSAIDEFCGSCGSAQLSRNVVVNACPKCGRQATAKEKFCRMCGGSMVATQ